MEYLGRQTVAIDTLRNHPLNEEVYGATTADADLIESIRITGLLQPPVITPIGDSGSYRIIAGHRRILALTELGIDTVECEVRTYENDDEETFDFLASNKHRVKDYSILVREIIKLDTLPQTSCHTSSDADSEGESDLPANFAGGDMSGLSSADVAVRMGIKPDLVKNIRTIHSPVYRAKFLADLEKSGTKVKRAALTRFLKEWDKASEDVLAGKIKPYEAATAIREARNVALGKKPAKKVAQPRAPKAKKASASEDVMEPMNNADNANNFIFSGDYDYTVVDDDNIVIARDELVKLLRDYATFCTTVS